MASDTEKGQYSRMRLSTDTADSSFLSYEQHDLSCDKCARRSRWLYLSMAAHIVFGVIVLALWTGYPQLRDETFSKNVLYSPANSAVERQDLLFHPALDDDGSSPYMGYPNERNHYAWDDLYNHVGVSRISTEEARPLLNRTLPIPGDDGHYVVQLAVFHQLHCLNHLRLMAWAPCGLKKDKFNVKGERIDPHLDHCIQVIRQAIMCQSDVTPLSLGRDPTNTNHTHAKWIMASVHTCRNFDRVHEWAERHKLTMPMDMKTVVKDDPLGWGDKPTYNYKFAVPVRAGPGPAGSKPSGVNSNRESRG